MPTISPQVTPYYGGGQAVAPANVIQVSGAPSSAAVANNIGTIAVDNAAANIYGLASLSGGTADWVLLGGSSATFTGLQGDNMASATPNAGVVNVYGTANQVSTSGASHTLTISLPSSVIAPGSLASTTTLASGTTLTAGSSLAVTTTAVVGTGLTVTSGGALVSAGDVTATAGNVILNGAGKQLRVHGGAATDFIGETTLVLGTKTINNTNIATADKIFLQRRSANSSTALGDLTYSISNGASFSITAVDPASPASTITADVSIVEYFIVRQV